MKLLTSDGSIVHLNKSEMIIGRDPSSDIYIADPRVSSRHAILQRSGDDFILTDLRSTNGTYVNRSRIYASYHLRPGDTITVGNYNLTLQTETPVSRKSVRSNQPANPSPILHKEEKSRSLALLIEIAPGLFGFLGVGWIYSGQTGVGVAILIANLVYLAVAAFVTIVTQGSGLCVLWPLEVCFLFASGFFLYRYTRKEAELFSP